MGFVSLNSSLVELVFACGACVLNGTGPTSYFIKNHGYFYVFFYTFTLFINILL
jgi:hypothetical protein